MLYSNLDYSDTITLESSLNSLLIDPLYYNWKLFLEKQSLVSNDLYNKKKKAYVLLALASTSNFLYTNSLWHQCVQRVNYGCLAHAANNEKL